MTSLITSGSAAAYVNWGRWWVDCAWCFGGGGQLEKLYVTHLVCQGCHQTTEVVWPKPSMVEGVTRLLLLRPNPRNRNWFPGETLLGLQEENAVNGVYDYLAGLDLPPGLALMCVREEEIVSDRLPQLNSRTGRQAVES